MYHKISVVCVDCESDYIDRVLSEQTYQNLEVVCAVTGEDFYQDIAEYCRDTDSEYICFLEPNYEMKPDKIQRMMEYALRMPGAEVIFCSRNYIEGDGTILAQPDLVYRDKLKDNLYDGSQILSVLLENGNNLLGSLTTVMFHRARVSLEMERLSQYETCGNPAMQKAFLMLEILAEHKMAILEEPLVDTYVEEFDPEKLKDDVSLFKDQIQVFGRLHGWEAFREVPTGIAKEHRVLLREETKYPEGIQKEITFFSKDKGEYYNLLPISEEAAKRGYRVRCADDLDEKAEIGVYCQHFGKPQNSKFSVVLLHDMAQGHNRWPNIWEVERWNVYDLGIVPGENWRGRWETCAFQYYCNPRCGAYMFGYPKSGQIFSEELAKRSDELRKSMNLKYDISVLYAPSWENDGKEDDFVRALSSLPVNLLIKQASWSVGYEQMNKNIADMRKLHEGKYENLHYIEPEESISVALNLCDLIVSDESSVMIEGLMFGKPSIAVSDWLIPDTEPGRFASIPFDCVYKCKKKELRETVERFLAGELADREVSENAGRMFANMKHVNKDIMDAIEYFTTGEGCKDFMKWKMSGRYMPANMWS